MFNRFKSFLHLSWLLAGRLVAETRRWHGKKSQGMNEIRVFYGHERIPGRHERSGGAMIKFQDLNDRFPNTLYHPNILYLVTSALPLYPEVIVRMAKRHGAFLVLNQNGVAYPGWHGPGWEKTNRTTRYLLKQADYVVYQSRFCKESADRFAGVCQAPWTILPNPVDTQVFVPNPTIPPGLRLFLAGSHQHWYRVRTALEALVHLPGSRLTIAGRLTFHPQESRCLEEVRGLAVHLGIMEQVELFGSYSQETAPSLFMNHHILLHTKYNDPCPRLVVEAMACGLPVVYSASGGVPELVGEEGGVGCETPCDFERDHPPDPVALARAVTTVAADLPRFAQQARLRAVDHFDVRPWLDRHEEIFSGLLAEETTPHLVK